MTLDPILAILPEVASPETSGAGRAIGPCHSSTQIPLNRAKTIKVQNPFPTSLRDLKTQRSRLSLSFSNIKGNQQNDH
jgi:hypothetical protein